MKIMRTVLSMEERDIVQNYEEINRDVGDKFIEAAENSREFNDLEAGIDEAEQVGTVVEEIAGHVEEAEKSEGGLTNHEAEAISVAVEHLCSRVGYSRRIMPSMESFQDKRQRSTKIALEGLGEFIESIWEAIKSAFTRAFEWISKTFKSIFGGKEKVAEKAKVVQQQSEQLQRQVDKDPQMQTAIEEAKKGIYAKKEQPGVAYIKNENLVEFFRTPNGQEVFSAEEILKRFETNLKGLDTALGNTDKYSLAKLAELIDAQAKSIAETGKGNLNEGYYYFDNFMKNLAKSGFHGYDKTNNTDPRYKAEPYSLAFDSSIVYYVAKNNKDEEALAGQRVETIAWPKNQHDGVLLDPASPNLTNDLAKEAYESAKEDKINKSVDLVEKALEKFKSESEKIIKDSEDEKKAQEISKSINRTNTLVMRILSAAKLLSIYQLKMTEKVLAYAQNSNQWVEQVVSNNG